GSRAPHGGDGGRSGIVGRTRLADGRAGIRRPRGGPLRRRTAGAEPLTGGNGAAAARAGGGDDDRQDARGRGLAPHRWALVPSSSSATARSGQAATAARADASWSAVRTSTATTA